MDTHRCSRKEGIVGTGSNILDLIKNKQNLDQYQQQHWHGTFAEYLEIVQKNPKVSRTAYQRLYDMITAAGTYPVEGREGLIRYKFFDDPEPKDRLLDGVMKNMQSNQSRVEFLVVDCFRSAHFS